MPESKHRRKNKNRPRPRQIAPPERNPEPSPAWVPIAGGSFLGLGVLVILLGYLPVVAARTSGLPLLGSNWTLAGGFTMLVVGFLFMTRWQ